VPLNKIVLVLEYDGTDYYGFQVQPNGVTVQEKLEVAIRKLTGEQLRIIPASRTDTGVHAKGQVISFMTACQLPAPVIIRALNHFLPEDIAVKEAYRTRDAFDVRKGALSREYKYNIWNQPIRSPYWNRFAHRVVEPLDLGAMNEMCGKLIGEHDFISFASDLDEGKTTRRIVYRADVQKEGDLIVFNIAANGFLTHQVRNTVGALIRAGQGKLTAAGFDIIMEAKKPGSAGPLAPARGLCLTKVNYPKPIEEEI